MTRSVVKHSYLRGPGAANHAREHANYIQHRSGQDKGTRLFFDSERDDIAGREVKDRIFEQDERGVVIHKLMLSPGVDGVDIKAFTREVMDEISKEKGLELDWNAIEHTNTDHVHAHVIIMGRDKNGLSVRFDGRRDYAKLREIGDRYLEREHYYDRYLDRDIHRLLTRKDYDRGGDERFQSLFFGKKDDRKRDKDPFRDDREFRKFDRDLKKAYAQIDRGRPIFRKFGKQQRIHEERGRLLEHHALYTANMERQRMSQLLERRRLLDKERAEETSNTNSTEEQSNNNGRENKLGLDALFGHNLTQQQHQLDVERVQFGNTREDGPERGDDSLAPGR